MKEKKDQNLFFSILSILFILSNNSSFLIRVDPRYGVRVPQVRGPFLVLPGKMAGRN